MENDLKWKLLRHQKFPVIIILIIQPHRQLPQHVHTSRSGIKGSTILILLAKGDQGVEGNQGIKTETTRITKARGNTPDFKLSCYILPLENIIVGTQNAKITRHRQDKCDSKPRPGNNGKRIEHLL